MAISGEQQRALDENGFVVWEDFIDPVWLDQLTQQIEELFRAEGDQAGAEFKLEAGCRRLANLADKGDVFRSAIVEPRLLELVEHVLGPEFKLSSQNARSVNPYCDTIQPLHADMAAVADENGFWVCNSVWMLDDFTPENGPLRLVPGSHHFGKLPQDVLDDLTAPHPDEIVVTGTAGTVIVMNAHVWHGGLPNRTARPRRAMHLFFARRDKPQQQYQKKLLRPEVQQLLSPQQRRLLALDDPLNDRLSEEPMPRSGFLK